MLTQLGEKLSYTFQNITHPRLLSEVQLPPPYVARYKDEVLCQLGVLIQASCLCRLAVSMENDWYMKLGHHFQNEELDRGDKSLNKSATELPFGAQHGKR